MKVSRSNKIKILILLTLIIVFIMIIFIIIRNDKVNKDKKIVVYTEEVVKVEVPDLEEVEEVIIPIVYDNMTLEELSNKLDRSLGSDISGYGNFIASYSLERGVDPYLATAIILHETGCTWGCSELVKKCNNVGGMKGSGCGAYGYFNTLEEGIQRFIDNIYNNYYAYGLTDAYLMGNKYAEDPEWSVKVNRHYEKVKNR